MSIPPKGKYAFKISRTQIDVFRRCERKYLYGYNSWSLSHEQGRECRFRHKPMGKNVLVGQLVDDVVTAILRRYKETGAFPSNADKAAPKFLEQYLDDSKSWRAAYDSGAEEPPETRRQPIDAYVWGEWPTEDELQGIIESANKFVRTWEQSAIPKEVAGFDVECLRVQEPGSKAAPVFPLQGYEVFAKYDFAIIEGSHATLYDWKTGRVSPQSEASATEQLHIYAMYAESEWKIPLENMELVPVWLALGPEMCRDSKTVDLSRIEHLRDDLLSLLRDLEKRKKLTRNLPDPSIEAMYPMTDNLQECAYCPFIHCEGKKRTAQPD